MTGSQKVEYYHRESLATTPEDVQELPREATLTTRLLIIGAGSLFINSSFN